MDPFKALKVYETRQAMQEAAGVTKQAVAAWFKKGKVPERMARRLADGSRGKLKFDPGLYA